METKTSHSKVILFTTLGLRLLPY